MINKEFESEIKNTLNISKSLIEVINENRKFIAKEKNDDMETYVFFDEFLRELKRLNNNLDNIIDILNDINRKYKIILNLKDNLLFIKIYNKDELEIYFDMLISSYNDFVLNVENHGIYNQFVNILRINDIYKVKNGLNLTDDEHDGLIKELLSNMSLKGIERFNLEIELKIKSMHSVLKKLTTYIESAEIQKNMLNVYESSKELIENQLNNYIDIKKVEIDRYFKSLQDQFNSLSERVKSVDGDLGRLSENSINLDKSKSELTEEFSNLSKKIYALDLAYDGVVKELDVKLDNRLQQVDEVTHKKINEKVHLIDGFIASSMDSIDKEVSSVNKTSKSFKEFIADETNIKITNDYKDKAFWEMWVYYGLSAASFLIIAIAIGYSIYSLHDFSTTLKEESVTSNDLTYLAIRLIFSVIIFSSIALTSRIASKAYTSWKKNEGIYLRLTALKPFIAEMSKEKQIEIHEKLIDVYFGKEEHDQSYNQKLKDLPNNITQLLGKVVEQTGAVLDVKNGKKDQEANSKPNE